MANKCPDCGGALVSYEREIVIYEDSRMDAPVAGVATIIECSKCKATWGKAERK